MAMGGMYGYRAGNGAVNPQNETNPFFGGSMPPTPYGNAQPPSNGSYGDGPESSAPPAWVTATQQQRSQGAPAGYQSEAARAGGGYSASTPAGAAVAPPGLAPVAAGSAGEDPRLTAILAQLQAQAGNTDSSINDQAAQSVAAQRAVAQRGVDTQLRRSLAANGLLPTGGQSERLRNELQSPLEAQLAAAQEAARSNLVGQRTATSNTLAGQLTALQQQRLQASQLAQQQAMAQQQFGMDQQKFSWEQQQAQQKFAFDQANQQSYLAQQAFDNKLHQQAAQLGYQNSAAGGGGGLGAATGWNNGVNSFLDPSGGGGGSKSGGAASGGGGTYNPITGMVDPGAARTAAYNSPGNMELRAQQAAKAPNPSTAGAPAPYKYTGGTGNGVSSAGTDTSGWFGGGVHQTGNAGGYAMNGANAAMSMPQYGAGQSAWGTSMNAYQAAGY